MGKNKQQNHRGRDHDRSYDNKGGFATIGGAMGVPGHNQKCIEAIRGIAKSRDAMQAARAKMTAECPGIAEFDKARASMDRAKSEFEKARDTFFILRKVVQTHPVFQAFETARLAFRQACKDRDAAKIGCARCEMTDPKLMLRGQPASGQVQAGREEMKPESPMPAPVSEPPDTTAHDHV